MRPTLHYNLKAFPFAHQKCRSISILKLFPYRRPKKKVTWTPIIQIWKCKIKSVRSGRANRERSRSWIFFHRIVSECFMHSPETNQRAQLSYGSLSYLLTDRWHHYYMWLHKTQGTRNFMMENMACTWCLRAYKPTAACAFLFRWFASMLQTLRGVVRNDESFAILGNTAMESCSGTCAWA